MKRAIPRHEEETGQDIVIEGVGVEKTEVEVGVTRKIGVDELLALLSQNLVHVLQRAIDGNMTSMRVEGFTNQIKGKIPITTLLVMEDMGTNNELTKNPKIKIISTDVMTEEETTIAEEDKNPNVKG